MIKTQATTARTGFLIGLLIALNDLLSRMRFSAFRIPVYGYAFLLRT
ncbi:MAG: hypothetical protein ABJI60_07680 [Kangiellaceae bacterium]